MKLYNYLIGFARAYPLIIICSSFLSYFLTFQINYFMLGIALLINDNLNGIFKIIIKSLFGEKIFGILGKRPIGAKNCGFFLNPKEYIIKIIWNAIRTFTKRCIFFNVYYYEYVR